MVASRSARASASVRWPARSRRDRGPGTSPRMRTRSAGGASAGREVQRLAVRDRARAGRRAATPPRRGGCDGREHGHVRESGTRHDVDGAKPVAVARRSSTNATAAERPCHPGPGQPVSDRMWAVRRPPMSRRGHRRARQQRRRRTTPARRTCEARPGMGDRHHEHQPDRTASTRHGPHLVARAVTPPRTPRPTEVGTAGDGRERRRPRPREKNVDVVAAPRAARGRPAPRDHRTMNTARRTRKITGMDPASTNHPGEERSLLTEARLETTVASTAETPLPSLVGATRAAVVLRSGHAGNAAAGAARPSEIGTTEADQEHRDEVARDQLYRGWSRQPGRGIGTRRAVRRARVGRARPRPGTARRSATRPAASTVGKAFSGTARREDDEQHVRGAGHHTHQHVGAVGRSQMGSPSCRPALPGTSMFSRPHRRRSRCRRIRCTDRAAHSRRRRRGAG